MPGDPHMRVTRELWSPGSAVDDLKISVLLDQPAEPGALEDERWVADLHVERGASDTAHLLHGRFVSGGAGARRDHDDDIDEVPGQPLDEGRLRQHRDRDDRAGSNAVPGPVATAHEGGDCAETKKKSAHLA